MHRVIAVAAAFAALLVLAGAALAAHNGNNKAEFTGAITGVAIVNYSEGRGDFSATITASGLTPGATYSFYVAGAGAGTAGVLICSATASSSGVFTCQAQRRVLPGFSRAEIRLGSVIVAADDFERRGNCRDPQQGGELCPAPGQDP